MEQLLEKGVRFGAVTVEELMEEAGMARATFYTHFRDRGELVMRLMRLVVEELAESTGTWIADAKNAHRADMEAALFGMVQTFKNTRRCWLPSPTWRHRIRACQICTNK